VDRRSRLAVAIAAVVLVLAAGCTSRDQATAGSDGTTPGTARSTADLLGPSRPATGTPIKVGMISDGKSDAIDGTPQQFAAAATAQYVNEHLGGIDGHPIDLDHCETGATPAGGTTCGVQMVQDHVAVVLTGVTSESATMYAAMKDSGIPFFSVVSSDETVLVSTATSVATNPVGAFGASVSLGQGKGIHKAAAIVIDVPEASGQAAAIADPLYKKAGIELDVIAVSPQVADMTPQIQQAISSGAQQFTILGTDAFDATGVKALKQLGFQGDILLASSIPPDLAETVPGGLAGVTTITSITDDPSDPDVQTFGAVMDGYAPGVVHDTWAIYGFQAVLSLVRALSGAPGAVDARGIAAALAAMPAPAALPMGGGIMFQCGTKPVSYAPSICARTVLVAQLDVDGRQQHHQVLDVTPYIKLN
jgi:ABC-type branched-subunit amino acid transport system substrate-binding protein